MRPVALAIDRLERPASLTRNKRSDVEREAGVVPNRLQQRTADIEDQDDEGGESVEEAVKARISEHGLSFR